MDNLLTLISLIISSGTLTAIIKAILEYRQYKQELKKTISEIDNEQNKHINLLITEIAKQNEQIAELKELTKNLIFISELESSLYNIFVQISGFATVDDSRKIKIQNLINTYITIAKNIIATNWKTSNVLSQLRLYFPEKTHYECEKFANQLKQLSELDNGHRRKKFLELSQEFIWTVIEKIS